MVKVLIGFYLLSILHSIFGAAYRVVAGHFELVTLHLFVGLISAGLLALVQSKKKETKI